MNRLIRCAARTPVVSQGFCGTKLVGQRAMHQSIVHQPVRQGQQQIGRPSLKRDFEEFVIECMNRNARKPKRANNGARPCSHVSRRAKRLKRHKSGKK